MQKEFLEIIFAKIFFFINVFIRDASFNVVINGVYYSVGNIVIFSTLPGSESIDVKNLLPKYET
jgi:hypothetical protein